MPFPFVWEIWVVMAVLQAVKGANPGQLFQIEKESVVLGRHPDCDIVLEVGAVSRQHARITKTGSDYFVEDLHSRNGTFVNEQSIKGQVRLEENDQVRICDLVFVFHSGLPQPVSGDNNQTTDKAMLVDDLPRESSTIMSRLDVSSGRTGIRLAVNAEAKLKALLEIGQNLGKVLTLDQVLQKILDSLFAVFIQADRGFIVLKEGGTDRLVPKAVKRRREQEDDQIRISRTIIREVMARKEAILSADASTDSRFQMSESIVDFHIHSMMCAPLVTSEGEVLGAIQIDTIDPRRRFNPEDLEVLASVACQAAVAVENAELHEVALKEEVFRQELTLAHQVQRGFLPDKPPQLSGYEFFDCYEPARHLGGDYFDYVPYRDGRLAVVLGDVSGKGIAAALLMAKLSAEVRYSLASESVPTAAIARLNEAFCESRWEDRFITLVAAVIDPARHEVAIINAGHLTPIVRRHDGQIEFVGEEQAGLPLGIAGGMAYEQTLVILEPGDAIMLYTDGIPDALNTALEFYGMDRLKEQLAASSSGVNALGKQLLASVRQFVGTQTQSDDMCVSCFGRVV